LQIAFRGRNLKIDKAKLVVRQGRKATDLVEDGWVAKLKPSYLFYRWFGFFVLCIQNYFEEA